MLERDGYQVVQHVIPHSQVLSLLAALDDLPYVDAHRSRAGRTYAMRDLLRLVPAVKQLTQAAEIRSLVEPVIGAQARPVRGLLFDKTVGANWKVAWHQDLSITVKAKRHVAAYGPWSMKS